MWNPDGSLLVKIIRNLCRAAAAGNDCQDETDAAGFSVSFEVLRTNICRKRFLFGNGVLQVCRQK